MCDDLFLEDIFYKLEFVNILFKDVNLDNCTNLTKKYLEEYETGNDKDKRIFLKEFLELHMNIFRKEIEEDSMYKELISKLKNLTTC